MLRRCAESVGVPLVGAQATRRIQPTGFYGDDHQRRRNISKARMLRDVPIRLRLTGV